MSDQTENQGTGSDLESLQAQAAERKIKHHPNMGAEKLQKLIQDYDAKPVKVNPINTAQPMTVSEITELQELRKLKAEIDAQKVAKPVLTQSQKVAAMIKKQSELVRVRVSNMDPNRRDWEGEMYTVGNRHIRFKRYVPFNNDEGWHVERMILTYMQNKKCQIFFTRKDNRGNKTRHGKTINALNVEIMDPLTIEEIKELAQRQAMARGEAA